MIVSWGNLYCDKLAFELSGVQFGPKSYTRDLFEITSVKHDFRPKLHDTKYNYLAKSLVIRKL